MTKLYENMMNRIQYSLESIKNRYPCKIIHITRNPAHCREPLIKFQAVTKLNMRELPLSQLLDDPLMIEKFHPTDCIKLGVLSAGPTILDHAETIEDAKHLYKKITTGIFNTIEME